jgi:hypothetical protein
VILFVSGPMTGLPDHNYPAFHAASQQLRKAGHTVVNPAAAGTVPGWAWQDYMRRGLTSLIRCDGVALLDGWTASRGAQMEMRVALAMNLPVHMLEDWLAREAVA